MHGSRVKMGEEQRQCRWDRRSRCARSEFHCNYVRQHDKDDPGWEEESFAQKNPAVKGDENEKSRWWG